jgi:hypothetical protein
VAEPAARPVSLGEVLVVAALVVGAVLGAAALTSLLPASFQQVVFGTPLAIAFLIGGTALVLWRISRRPRA